MKDDSRIVMHDFIRLIDAKQMAMSLMEEGVQFTFCANPISISHPMVMSDERSDTSIDGSEK